MAAVGEEKGGEEEPAQKWEVPEPMESCLRSMETTHRTILMLRCKVVVVGDATVGKSALISMFHSGGASYPKQYVMTSWVDFRVKQVDIPDTSMAVELYLFDCAGDPVRSRRPVVCCGGFTSFKLLVSIARCRGWFLFRV